jgi:hypothetical protein
MADSELNEDSVATLLRGQFKEAQREPGQKVGYVGAGGEPLPVKGDEDGPMYRTPPFPTLPELLFDDVLPSAEATTPTQAIEVSKQRALSLWLEYVPAQPEGGNSQLLLIAEALRADTEDAWYPVAVVNATITPDVLPDLPGAGTRVMYQTALLSPGFAGDGEVFRTVLQFDVGPYQKFRFRVGEMSEASLSTAKLHYSFAS